MQWREKTTYNLETKLSQNYSIHFLIGNIGMVYYEHQGSLLNQWKVDSNKWQFRLEMTNISQIGERQT